MTGGTVGKAFRSCLDFIRAHARKLASLAIIAVAAPTILILAYKPTHTSVLLRVLTDRENCVVGGPGQAEAFGGAEIEAAVGSWLIKSSVSALAKYLSDAANSTSSDLLTSVGDARFFKISADQKGKVTVRGNLACVVIITGAFGNLDVKSIPPNFRLRGYLEANDPDQVFVKRVDNKFDLSLLKKLGLIDLPNTYFEFQVEHDSFSKAFHLRPTVAYVREFNSIRGKNDPKTVEITLTIAKPSPTGVLDGHTGSVTDGLISQIPVVLPQLRKQRIRSSEIKVEEYNTVWIAEPETFRSAILDTAGSNIGPGETQYGPIVNVFATYRELDDPELLFYILSKIVDQNAEGIDDSLAKGVKLIPGKTD